MSIVFIEGFDYHASVANVAASNWTVNSTSNASLVAGRFAGQAFQHTGTSQRYLERAIPATNTLSLGVAIRIGDITDLAEQTSLLSFFNASAQLQIAIDITVTGQIIALRGATGLGTSAEEEPIFEDGVWRYIEVELFINDATGYVKVYRDGALILNVENVDTQNQSGDDIGVVRMWGCEAGNAVTVFAYDDRRRHPPRRVPRQHARADQRHARCRLDAARRRRSLRRGGR